MKDIGMLKIYLYLGEPQLVGERVRYTKKTLYSANHVTQDEAIELKKRFEELNALGANGTQAVWVRYPIELED